MTKHVVTIAPDTPVSDAAKIMLENHVSGLPVVDATGKLVGITFLDDRQMHLSTMI